MLVGAGPLGSAPLGYSGALDGAAVGLVATLSLTGQAGSVIAHAAVTGVLGRLQLVTQAPAAMLRIQGIPPSAVQAGQTAGDQILGPGFWPLGGAPLADGPLPSGWVQVAAQPAARLSLVGQAAIPFATLQLSGVPGLVSADLMVRGDQSTAVLSLLGRDGVVSATSVPLGAILQSPNEARVLVIREENRVSYVVIEPRVMTIEACSRTIEVPFMDRSMVIEPETRVIQIPSL